MSASRTCAGCGRIVLVEHVDASGHCCYCEQPKPTEQTQSAHEQEQPDKPFFTNARETLSMLRSK